MQFAARQGRLEHVAGVDGAFGLSRPHHGVQLVDEDDGLALVFRQLVQHGLEALLEFAAVLRARKQGCHVERQHPLALERFGHFARNDSLGQAFHDGGLADAGFTNQHRVVLGAPLQHLDRAANLIVAADHGIELALAGPLGQVHAVFLEGFALAFGFGAVNARSAAYGIHRRLQRLARQPVLAGNPADVLFGVRQGKQEELAGDELVAPFERLLLGSLHQRHQVAAYLNLFLALYGRPLVHGGLGRGQQALHIDTGALQQRARAVLLAQHGHQNVLGLDIGMVVAEGKRLRLSQRFLEFGCQFVKSHGG